MSDKPSVGTRLAFRFGSSPGGLHSNRTRQAFSDERACRPSFTLALCIPLLVSLSWVCVEEPAIDDETSSAELALLEDVDELRAREGLPPLERDYALGLVARDYSREMARAHEVRHGLTDPLPERVRSVAPETCVFAENLARHVDVGAVVPGWLASETHRRNLLDPELRRSGMGVVRGDDGFFYITHLFAGPCPPRARP